MVRFTQKGGSRGAATVLCNNVVKKIFNKSTYSKLNKSVKYQVKQWKRKLLEKEVVEMEDAFAKINSHEFFKKVRKLSAR